MAQGVPQIRAYHAANMQISAECECYISLPTLVRDDSHSKCADSHMSCQLRKVSCLIPQMPKRKDLFARDGINCCFLFYLFTENERRNN